MRRKHGLFLFRLGSVTDRSDDGIIDVLKSKEETFDVVRSNIESMMRKGEKAVALCAVQTPFEHGEWQFSTRCERHYCCTDT